ncbi:MAG TPA: SCO family protein [Gemmatimonadales bacterium]|nr:SCO family protein [Gemmatimonadales bacterium]
MNLQRMLLPAVVLLVGACKAAPKPAASATAPAAPADSASAMHGLELLPPRAKPEFTLTDTEGKPFDFRRATDGYATLLFFGYTHCPDVCPVHVANIAAVLHNLPPTVSQRVKMVFVTTDPERDTPEVLREYAKAYRAGPGWTFLTGAEEDVALIRKKFGDLNPIEDHAARLTVGNDRIGQWMSTAALDDPAYLATVVADWLDPEWSKRPLPRSYADAPAIGRPTQAATTFRGKCAACHTSDGRSVGPSLVGVTGRRSREWLVRWIVSPKELVEQRDAAALELVKRHGGAPLMPDLDIGEAEARALVDHLSTLAPPAPAEPKKVTLLTGDRP